MMSSKESSYSRIVKTSSILAGSSLIDILLRIIRTKVLAVFLGPAMFGTLTLYSGLVDMICSITSLGIGQSAVRDIAKASTTNDLTRIARVIVILRRVVWLTGILGLIITVSIAYPASLWMFNNIEHVLAIAILGLVVLFTQIKSGQLALLSGLRLISEVAKANVLGSFLGTLIAVPVIYLFNEKGIIPFLLAIALGQLVASWWYARKKLLPQVSVDWKEFVNGSSEMVRLGLVLMVASVTLSVSIYLIRLIIQTNLGEASVGIYQAAYTMSGIYVGFILKAMSGDYFPHLTILADDKNARNKLVNEQMEIAILIAVPGLIALLLLSDKLFWLLYSDRFENGTDVLRWLILGMLGQIISWPMGFLLMARSDKIAFVTSEVLFAVLHIYFVWLGIQHYGIDGVGMAFFGMYTLHIILIAYLVITRHAFSFFKSTLLLIYSGCFLVFLAFFTAYINEELVRYFFCGIIFLYSLYWTITGFCQLMGKEKVMSIWHNLLQKARIGKA